MRILDVAPRVGSLRRGGSQVRMQAILGGLRERHDVRAFAQPRLGDLRAVRDLPHGDHAHRNPIAALISEPTEHLWTSAPVLSGAALTATRPRRLRELARWADVVMVEFPWQFAHCAGVAAGRPLVLAAHNVEAEKFVAYTNAAGVGARARPLLASVERMERDAVARAELVLAVSDDDRHGLARRYGIDAERVVVAPNGADVSAIEPASPERRASARRALGLPDRSVAIYAGANTTPNRHGRDWVLEVARRTPSHTFLVVGAVGGRPRREGNVVFTGWVDDFHGHLAAADVALAPIEHGGGTKIKVLESLAAGLPCVVFGEAVAGTKARHDEHVLLVEETVESLCAALGLLAGDPELAGRLGRSGRRLVVERHDWRSTARVVEEALLELVGERRPAAATAAPRFAAPRG